MNVLLLIVSTHELHNMFWPVLFVLVSIGCSCLYNEFTMANGPTFCEPERYVVNCRYFLTGVVLCVYEKGKATFCKTKFYFCYICISNYGVVDKMFE